MTARAAVFWYITVTVIGAIISVPKFGPFEVIVNEVRHCADEGTRQFRFSTKPNYLGGGKHVYSSDVVYGHPIDENFMMKADLQQWSHQGYRPRAMTYTVKGCKNAWAVGKSFIISMARAAGLNITGCPIPQGNYSVTNWEVKFQLDAIPVMFYNKYKLVIEFHYKDEKAGCGIILLETVPKKQ